MKQLLTLVALAATAFTIQAQPIVARLTGATAYRAEVFNTLNQMFLGTATSTTPYTYNSGTYFVTGTASANQYTFAGVVKAGYGTLSGRQVSVRCSYSGSVAGINAVIAGTSVNFLLEGGGSENVAADYANSDVFAATAGINTTLTDTPLGIIPFVFCANGAAKALGINNITDQQLAYLAPNGVVPAALLTGNASDQTVGVNLVGRDSGSGTRACMLSETGYGVGGTVLQRRLSGTDWIFDAVGYGSGSNVRTDLNITSADVDSEGNGFAANAAIGYMSVGDAWRLNGTDGVEPGSTASATGAGDAYTWWLSYNGSNPVGATTVPAVGTGLNRAAFAQGKYTFWGYAHFYGSRAGDLENVWRPNFAAAVNAYVATSPSAISSTEMSVQRQADGGVVTASYF